MAEIVGLVASAVTCEFSKHVLVHNQADEP